jgi:type I restriction enzyme S subunit
MLISRDVEGANPRTRLQVGDVVVVLVGRIGEAASVASEHEGWNTARSVAVVRCADPTIAEWLQVWLTTPVTRAWCVAHASGSAQATLGLAKLRRLAVPLPPSDMRDRLLRTVKTIEARIEVNERIGQTAVALADTHFAIAQAERAAWPQVHFADVIAQVRTGAAAKHAKSTAEKAGMAWVAPADVLRNQLPYLDQTGERVERRESGDHKVRPPNAVLVAPKAGALHAAVSQIPLVAGRGVLEVRPHDPSDVWWLLHEIRFRSGELSALGQGTAAREVSARAFLRAPVSWPPPEVRARFTRLAAALHARALTTVRENRALQLLLLESVRREVPGALPAELAVTVPTLRHGTS